MDFICSACRAMEQIKSAFINLFMQINATFSKDSSDCLATLSSAAECIQFLVTLPETPPTGEDGQLASSTPERTFTISYREVQEMLGWSNKNEVIAHPLDDLDTLLHVSGEVCEG